MLYLGHQHITQLIDAVGLHQFADGLAQRMRDSMINLRRDQVDTPRRSGFQYTTPTTGLIEWMPAHEIGRTVGVKMVAYHPSNPFQHGIPTVTAATSLYDTRCGRQTALVDSTLLTALRTGAASAIATDIFARPGSIRLGIIGCGAQAVAQAHAISRVRHVHEVIAFDINPTVSKSLIRRLGRLHLAVRTVDFEQLETIRATADVMCTVTSVDPEAGPVFADGAHHPWLHINAMGSDFPGKTEIPTSLLKRATVITDHHDQCRAEGESQQLDDSDVGPELREVVQHESDWASYRETLTVFDSTGHSLFDLVAAEYAVDLATKCSLGMELDSNQGGDPYDPYVALHRDALS
jgi:L-lysine cyclodeaminase